MIQSSIESSRSIHDRRATAVSRFPAVIAIFSALSLFAPLAALAQPAQNIPLQIEHIPLTQFTWGAVVEIKASVRGEPAGVNFYYRQAGVIEFQVRPLTKAEDGSYILAFETTALTGMSFEYYLEAFKGKTKAVFPPEAPGKMISVEGQGQNPPSVPADIPAPQAEESKFQFPVNVTGSGLATLSETQSQPGVAKTQGNGNVRVAVQHTTPSRYDLNVDSNFLYAGAPIPGTKPFDLSNMIVSVTKGNHVLRAGDLDLTESDYTVFGLGRRGFEYVFTDQKLYVRGFMSSSEQSKGFQGFGYPHEAVRILGGIAGYKLFNDAVSLKAIYVGGKDDPSQAVNVGTSPLVTSRQGNVAALVEETHLFQQALNLKAEVAASHYDADLKDDKGETTDYAYQLGTDFRSGSFTGSAKYRHVGRDFNSIGLQFIANDRQGLEANLGFMSGKVSLQGMYTREQDNVKDDPSRNTTKMQNGQVMGTLTLAGNLVLNAGYRLNGQDTVQGGLKLQIQDSVTHEATAGVNWMPWPSTSFNCMLVNSDIASMSNPSGDTRALTFNTALSYQSGQVWTFSPSFTWSRSVYPALNAICHSLNFNIATELYFVRQILSLAFFGTGNRTELPGVGPTSLVNLTGGANLQVGNLIKFKTIVLSLKGSYNRMTMSGQTIIDTRVFVQGDLAF